MTTYSTQNQTVFCPRDGSKWYACTSGSQFVGCCKLKPCETGCAEGYISPALMAADTYGQLPDPTCPSGANSYTCSVRRLAFFGCCASNACVPGGCPPADVRSAYMDLKFQFNSFLNVTQPSLLAISTGLVADGPPTILPIPSRGSENGHSTPRVVIGLCMTLLLALPVMLGIWIGVRHWLGNGRTRSKSAEWISLPTYPENGKLAEIHDSPSPCPYTVLKDISRLGYMTLGVLSATGLVTLGVSGFLSFLWLEDSDNKSWHSIMLNNWATRAVSISALLLRTSADFQAAIASSIIVSLLLESRTGVHIPHLAGLSPMRTGSASPGTLISFLIRDFWRATRKSARKQGWGIISGCLLFTTGVLQFSSTLLLSDLKPGVLGGQAIKSQVKNSLSYRDVTRRITRDSAWTTNPPFYPSFGEYSEPPEGSEGGVDDTGVLLRTFLPYATAESRQNLRTYFGKGLVLDARVSCQAPDVTWGYNAGHFGMLTGGVDITRNVTLLQEMTASTFSCAIAGLNEYTLCQIGRPYPWFMGSLTSQFENSTSFGTAFLVIKGTERTSPSESDESRPEWYRDPGEEWLNADFANGTGTGASLSLCFAPWDASVLDVELSSTSNRTEPLIQWWEAFKTSDILDHLLPQRHITRQILKMSKPHSFRGDLPPKEERPLVQSDASGSSAAGYGANTPLPENWSIFLNGQPLITTLNNFSRGPTQTIADDPALAAIFTDAMDSTGSVAWSLSSLLTVLSMSNYYSQQPAFDRLDDVTVSFFTTVFFPQKKLGLMLLMCTLVAHLLIVVVLVILFIKRTQLTLLGNAWSVFLQMANSRDLMASLKDMDQKTDSMIQEEMNQTRTADLRARIDRKGDRVEVVLT